VTADGHRLPTPLAEQLPTNVGHRGPLGTVRDGGGAAATYATSLDLTSGVFVDIWWFVYHRRKAPRGTRATYRVNADRSGMGCAVHVKVCRLGTDVKRPSKSAARKPVNGVAASVHRHR
jgi:hypothetical protein